MSQCNSVDLVGNNWLNIAGCYIVTLTKKWKNERFTSLVTFVSNIELNSSFLVSSKLIICTK